MIWNDVRLAGACALDNLVTPFDPQCVNPASIDLRLGTSYRLPHAMWQSSGTRVNVADPAHLAKFPTWGDEQQMPAEGIVLQPGQFVLCSTVETVAIPADACAELFSKSSTGRMGIEHLHAGWVDPGFCGQLTLELKNVTCWPLALIPGKRYMQMVVHDLIAAAARDYSQTGRYQNQQGATPAREVR